ncbi:hypothetical protein KUTeg_018347 [Tegillarca granosa]|uniref:Uncharacterized protein n=1 Tax=Tegillarca granosa TaxID=220873 RepID=A0ABQ9EHL2_TEGGR|nr:hypothetical protein KUTeg_018347 [Tegillarca granosa]
METVVGYSENNPPCFDSKQINPSPPSRCQVIKCGATTGLTMGMLCGEGIYARMENIHMRFGGNSQIHFEFYNQYDVFSLQHHAFFKSGDSGSIVLVGLGQNLGAVGMAIGQTTYGSSIVTPIEDILKKLELSEENVTAFRSKAKGKKRKIDSSQNAVDKEVQEKNKDDVDVITDKVNNINISDHNLNYVSSAAAGASAALPQVCISSNLETEDRIDYETKGARPKTKVEKSENNQREPLHFEQSEKETALKQNESSENERCKIKTKNGTEISLTKGSIINFSDDENLKKILVG